MPVKVKTIAICWNHFLLGTASHWKWKAVLKLKQR